MDENRGLWRGKRFDNGEWINGYYVEFEIGKKPIPCIIPFSQLCNVFPDKGVYQVDPSTLGRCSEVPDKNGKLIFEGDIVTVIQSKNKAMATIYYENGAFIVTPVSGNIYERTLWDYWYNDWAIEIIGNIHDNPELLRRATGEDIGNAAQDTIAPAT